MNFDVLIVGAGPSGLSSGIKLAQLAKKNNKSLQTISVNNIESLNNARNLIESSSK